MYPASRLQIIKIIQSVPIATEPGCLADRCSVSQQLSALQTHTTHTHYRHTIHTHTTDTHYTHTHTTDTFLFISHTTNVLLFKFRCNIFIGVRIIKEMPGSVASGTHCIKQRKNLSLKERDKLKIDPITKTEWKE